MKDDAFYVLFYLNNWDFYGTYMDSAPLPESRKNKYNEIMDRFQHREIGGSGVTSELASWLINFDTNNRKKFLDWVAERRSIQTTKMTKVILTTILKKGIKKRRFHIRRIMLQKNIS